MADGEDRSPPRRRRRLVAGPVRSLYWVQIYQSGRWIEALIGRYLDGGPGADAYRVRARALLLGWLRNVLIQARGPLTLICPSEAFPGQGWIEDQIPPMVGYQAARWQGAWNHELE